MPASSEYQQDWTLQTLVDYARVCGDLSNFPGNPETPEEVTRKGAGCLSLQLLCSWVEYVVKGSSGKLSQLMSVSSAKTMCGTLPAGYERKTGTPSPRSLSTSVKAYIDTNRRAWGMEDVSRPKAHAD